MKQAEYNELLIGCGSEQSKRYGTGQADKDPGWKNLTTLDNNPDHKPDIIHDLKTLPLPFEDNSFDEIHAYEVLEHLYQQGDYISFFAEFTEYYRILKPSGLMFITVPKPNSVWALGDPSHTRIMPPENFTFLSQEEYEKQVGITPMSDFRYIYKADLRIRAIQDANEECNLILLEAIK